MVNVVNKKIGHAKIILKYIHFFSLLATRVQEKLIFKMTKTGSFISKAQTNNEV